MKSMFYYYFKVVGSVELETLFSLFDYTIVTLVKINYIHSFPHWVDFLLIVAMIDSRHHFNQT